DAPWTVVTVQTRTVAEDDWQLEIDRAFALARRLGGDTALLHGTGIADALLDFAAQNGVSTLVLGRTRERPLARMFNRTLTQQLLRRGAHYELVIVSSADARARAGAGGARGNGCAATTWPMPRSPRPVRSAWPGCCSAGPTSTTCRWCSSSRW